MFSKLKTRYIAYIVVVFVLLTTLIVQLYSLNIRHAEEYTSQVSTNNEKTVSVKGARGSIMDKNGVLLAYDVSSYDVQFYKDPAENASSDRAFYTDVIQKTIELIESKGGEIIDTFMIRRGEDGTFSYDIDDSITGEARENRINNWCENMQISKVKDAEGNSVYPDPENIYYDLRTRYRIPESMAYEDAVKLLSIWQEVQLMTYRSYIPVTIAYNVNFETVSEIETRANELKGMQIEESSTRVYPKKTVAAHIVGYMGRMVSEEEIEEKEAQGYSQDDLVGKVGIEATMEEYLTGNSKEHQGKKVLEVDSAGTVVRQVSYTPPTPGNKVVLTIDYQLQELLERTLAENIQTVYAEQQDMYNNADPEQRKEYDEILAKRSTKTINYVQSGACIVMEVKTGKVLALVSSPSYDPNLFTGGISEEDFKMLNEDPAKPLFNNAISSVSTPGSIFKLCTALAGLMEEEITLTGPKGIINDEGPYTKHLQEGATIVGHIPSCWTKYPQNHAHNQDVVAALKNSCNYYFYEVAYRLGNDRLNEWADKLGLTSKTGIELTGEVAGRVGNKNVLYDPSKDIDDQVTYKPLLVYNKLVGQLRDYGTERGVTYTDDQVKAAATRIMQTAGEKGLVIGKEIRQILSEELDIPENVSSSRGWSNEIVNTVREVVWTDNDTIVQGIGSEPTQLSPIAVARYLCAIVNGGKVFQPHIVEKIVDNEGNVVKTFEPTVVTDLQIPEEYTNAIMEGMDQVVSAEDGTASQAFGNFKYRDILAGKTGTGVVSDIDIEDNVWLCLVAPKDDTEIAVVCFLPHGFSDSKAYPTAKAAIQYYFDQKNAPAETEPQASPEGGLLE